jgi:hypothetical protein
LNPNSSDLYFAQKSGKILGGELKKLVDQYYIFMNTSGIFRRMTISNLHYHGISPHNQSQSDQIRPGGRNGNLSLVKVNHYRNFAQHLLNLTTSQRPSPQPIAANTDAKSQEQATLAKGILDYYGREKRVERVLRTAAEYAVVLSEGYVLTLWQDPENTNLGGVSDDENGDIDCRAFAPSDIIKDPTKTSYDQMDWVIARSWANRYAAADEWAATEQMRTTVLGQKTKNTYLREQSTLFNWVLGSNMRQNVASDEIAIYSFFHKRTASVPEGRYVVFMEDGSILYEGNLPYKSVTLRRICPGEILGSPFGYTPMFDLMVIQQAIDALYSAIATNQITFGVQLIMAQKGSDIDYKQLARGLSYIEYASPEGKPEALNLTTTPAEIFEFIKQLEGVMETISGVNAVVRGNTPENLKSGSALALIQSQAIAFSSGLQQSYAHLVEDVYTDILDIIKQYADNEKTITIVGKYNRPMLRSFKGADISEIRRVTVNASSPLEQTVSGRIEIARDLIQNKIVTTPEQYLSIIRTGSLDMLVEGDHSELLLIKSENEDLSNKQPVKAVVTDNHALHIKEHKAVLASPEVRMNMEVVMVTQQHLLEHIQILSDPAFTNLLVVLGQQPLAMALMPEPGQGYAPAEAEAAGAPGNAGAQMEPTDLSGSDAKLPKNPQTGNEWDPQTGGGVTP